MLQRMSVRKYVSMSRERHYNISLQSPDFLQSSNTSAFDFTQEVDLGLQEFASLLDYITKPGSKETVDFEKEHSSAFEARTPGVMTLEHVRREINLDEWKLKLGDITVKFEVRPI